MPRRAEAPNVVKFTKAVLAKLAPDEGQGERIVWDAEVRGFGIRLRGSGARAWVIRPPRGGGASKLHTLGPADAIDLAAARSLAQEKLAEAALGGDPTRAKAEARRAAAMTFGGLIAGYIADKEAKGRRTSTIGNLRNHLNSHWAPLHARPLNAVTRAEVAARHREIAAESGPHAADRARSVLSTFFTWAMAEGLAEANPVANTNTATVPTRRDRVLSDAELVAVWRASRDDDFGRIVRLLVLTGQRLREVAGLRRSELDPSGVLWTLPASRSKNRRAHEIPLSSLAAAVLAGAGQRVERDHVFGDGAGAFSGFSRAKAALDRRISGAAGAWTLHDLRRTVATRMGDLGVQPHIVEAVLNHVSGSRAGVAGTYNRALYRPEKRAALELWSAHVAGLTGGEG